MPDSLEQQRREIDQSLSDMFNRTKREQEAKPGLNVDPRSVDFQTEVINAAAVAARRDSAIAERSKPANPFRPLNTTRAPR